MGLNDTATTHLANKETVIPTNIGPDHSKTQPDTVTCRTSTRAKRPPITRQNDFFMVIFTLSLENSNVCNQYDSSDTNIYPDCNLNPPSFNKVNYDLNDSSNNLKVYHQNIRGLRGKVSQLSTILCSELPYI